MFGGTGGAFYALHGRQREGRRGCGDWLPAPKQFSAMTYQRHDVSSQSRQCGPGHPLSFWSGKVAHQIAHQLEGKRWFSTASDGNEATGRPQKTMLNATQAACLIPL